MRKEDCLFCKIVAGEIPSTKVYEDERVLVVRQYRHPVGFRLLEPPAGLLDLDGSPIWPDGRYALRVMEMSGDEGSKVKVTFDQAVDPWEGVA